MVLNKLNDNDVEIMYDVYYAMSAFTNDHFMKGFNRKKNSFGI